MDKEDVRALIKNAIQEKATKLDLSNRDIQELPSEIGELTELKHLNISYNKLTTLPKELGNLKKLDTLLIYRNKLTDMGPICTLTRLTTIDICYNYITEIPEEIGNLSELTTLDISYCQIERLPFSFTKLLSLKAFHSENNNFLYPPKKVIKRGIYATMYFLTQEKKKLDARKIHIQVFNMPQEAQIAFNEYIECFNKVLFPNEDIKALFDIKHINSDSSKKISENQMQEYFFSFISYIKENINNFNEDPEKKDKIKIFDLQVADLRNQINILNSSLESKIDDIQNIQDKLLIILKRLEK